MRLQKIGSFASVVCVYNVFSWSAHRILSESGGQIVEEVEVLELDINFGLLAAFTVRLHVRFRMLFSCYEVESLELLYSAEKLTKGLKLQGSTYA